MHNTVLIIQDTHKLYAVCEACSVFAIHYKYINIYVREKHKEYRVHRPFIRKESFVESAMGCVKNYRAGQVLRFPSHLHLTRYMIIARHTYIFKKGEIYQKPKTLIVWVGET